MVEVDERMDEVTRAQYQLADKVSKQFFLGSPTHEHRTIYRSAFLEGMLAGSQIAMLASQKKIKTLTEKTMIELINEIGNEK